MSITLSEIVLVAGGLATIIGLISQIIKPFQKVMRENSTTMRSLQDAIKDLSRDLKESQKDRDLIHIVLEKHTEQIGILEDDQLIIKERINHLSSEKNKGGM